VVVLSLYISPPLPEESGPTVREAWGNLLLPRGVRATPTSGKFPATFAVVLGRRPRFLLSPFGFKAARLNVSSLTMAINYRKGPRTLVKELRQSGFKITDVLSDAGDPSRSLQILLENGAILNWDRDSYSVWADGPPPIARRVENRVAELSRRRQSKRSRRAGFWKILLGVALVAAVFAYLHSKAKHANDTPKPAVIESGGE
jgi:hypothetical protein